MIDFEKEKIKVAQNIAKIKVVGIGGAGCNTINSMVEAGYETIEFFAANTDAQSLDNCKADHQIKLGYKLTKGLGSGSDPSIGKKSAEEDRDRIAEQLQDADIVFLTAGLGGGTGSGALPVIAQELKERDILCVAVVTQPFAFEGKRRKDVSDAALAEIKKHIDTLIVIPNQKLLSVADKNVSLVDAFGMINNVVGQFVNSVSNIITRPGHINVDFADIKAIMKNMGGAIMGTGRASGENRAEEATLQAIASPLLDDHSITGARGILLNITGNKNLGLHEVSQAASLLYEQADEEASIVLGSVIDESMGDEVAVTIIATGFKQQPDSSLVAEASPEQSQKIDTQPTDATSMTEDMTPSHTEQRPQTTNPEEIRVRQAVKNDSTDIDLEDIETPTYLRRLAEKEKTEQS